MIVYSCCREESVFSCCSLLPSPCRVLHTRHLAAKIISTPGQRALELRVLLRLSRVHAVGRPGCRAELTGRQADSGAELWKLCSPDSHFALRNFLRQLVRSRCGRWNACPLPCLPTHSSMCTSRLRLPPKCTPCCPPARPPSVPTTHRSPKEQAHAPCLRNPPLVFPPPPTKPGPAFSSSVRLISLQCPGAP